MLLFSTSGSPAVVPWSFSAPGEVPVSHHGLLKGSRAGLGVQRFLPWLLWEQTFSAPSSFWLCLVIDCQQRNGVESSCAAFVSPNPSFLLLHSYSWALSSSTSCKNLLAITNSLFLSPIDRDEFIPSIASCHLVNILLLFSMFLSYLWIYFPQIFVSFSFLALSWHSCHLTFLLWCIFFSLFSCSAVCEMHWTVELPRSIKQWGRDKSIELQECTLSSVCCLRQNSFPVVQLYLCCRSFGTNYDICCSFIFAFLGIQSNSIGEKYSFWTRFSPVEKPRKKKKSSEPEQFKILALQANPVKSSKMHSNYLCILKLDFS